MELYHGRYPNLVDPARRILLIRVICVIRVIRSTERIAEQIASAIVIQTTQSPHAIHSSLTPDHRPLILAIP